MPPVHVLYSTEYSVSITDCRFSQRLKQNLVGSFIGVYSERNFRNLLYACNLFVPFGLRDGGGQGQV